MVFGARRTRECQDVRGEERTDDPPYVGSAVLILHFFEQLIFSLWMQKFFLRTQKIFLFEHNFFNQLVLIPSIANQSGFGTLVVEI